MEQRRQVSPTVLSNLFQSREKAQGLGRAAEAYVAAVRLRASLTRATLIAFVIAPTLAASIFYGLLAAPRYVSDVRFVVRSVAAQRPSGLDMLFRTFGIARTVDDAYIIQKYLVSRDAMHALIEKGVDLNAMFSRPDADRLSRYPRPWQQDSSESLFDYYLDRVTVKEDSVKGIIDLRVVAFAPEDARLLAATLLGLAENMVNRMNERAQRDAMASAQREVATVEASVLAAQAELTAFRNRERLVDPAKSNLSVIETVGNLSTDLAYASAQLRELEGGSPGNPGIGALRARIASLTERIAIEKSKAAGPADSLAGKLATFEQLMLRREIADKSLSASLNSLDAARQEARRQHIYIEAVVAPNLPDAPVEPERLRAVLTVLVFGFALFSVTWILSVGAGEHSQ